MLRSLLVALVFTLITIRAEAVQWSVYAGADGGPGAVDATGTAARFKNPQGLAVDAQGNAYVADGLNATIRKVTPGGVVTTLAGQAGVSGHVDDKGAAARFSYLSAIALRPDGSLVVADSNTLRAVALDGTVSTLAGTGASGDLDGPAAQATFSSPTALAVDAAGNIYLIESNGIAGVVRVLTAGGQVLTLAGSPTEAGNVDGQGSAARFSQNVTGMTLGPDGNLYVSDNANGGSIRQVTPTGAVTTYASGAGAFGILADASGNLYVAGGAVRKVAAAAGHAVTDVVSYNGSGYLDGPAAVAQFSAITFLAFAADGALLAVDGNAIRKVTLAGDVTTLAGKNVVTGSADGTGTAATFNQPSGLGVDAAGNVYVADRGNSTIRQIAPGGVVTTWAGQAGVYATVDDTGIAARFASPYALAAQADGTLYVMDTGSQLLRKITPQAVVSTLAGTLNTTGSMDGQGTLASFNYAAGVGVAPAGGTIAIGDTQNQTIRTVTPLGLVATLAGMVGQTGAVDAHGTSASFNSPQGAAVDAAGNVYVADSYNNKIRKVTSGGDVSTLAGSGVYGLVDGVGVNAKFANPAGVAVDANGNVFVADNGTHAIRKVTPSGRVITIGGNGTSGVSPGVGTAALFTYPVGIAVAANGTLYVTDASQRIVQGVDNSTEPPLLTAPVASSATSHPVTVSYELTEPAKSGTVTVKFASTSNVTSVGLTLKPAYETEGVHTFTFEPANPGASSAVLSVAGGTTIPDGSYTVTLRYQDVPGNPAATAQATAVTIDTVTQTPTLGAPYNGGELSSSVSVSAIGYILPEAALAGSVQLIFDDGSGTTHPITIGGVGEQSGPHTLQFNPASPNRAGNSVVPSTSGSPIPDGTYTVTLSYRDAVGNPAATAQQLGVIVDTVTKTPTLTTPTASSVLGKSITLSYTLPEAPATSGLPGSVSVSFGSSYTLYLAAAYQVAGTQTITFNPADPVGTSNGAFDGTYSSASIPDGLYNVKLSYYDTGYNPAATATSTNVRVDTTAPTIVLPTNGFTGLRVAAGSLPDYTGQITTMDATNVSVTQFPLSLATTTYTGQPITVTLTATDAAGNQSTYDITVDVRPTAAINTVAFTASTKAGVPGDPAPGAGTHGLPADARLASFGPPAIDENGAVAFLAHWTSATGPLKKGTGIFTETTCVATLGGPTPVNGASYKSFLDPVISQGKVAFLATLGGGPAAQASVLLSDAPTGTLDVVAQTGVDLSAAGLPGVTFKSFKGAQVFGNIVGFSAQLAGGTGAAKVTAANDLSLWAKNATDPLAIYLREGDTVDPNSTPVKKLKTLVSFAVGAGSPGQGRGWLSDPYGAFLLALGFLDDKAKTQAVINASSGGLDVYSQSGSTTIGAPTLTGATFQSYSFPAFNNSYAVAFLGTLTPGTPPAVTKANAQGIFFAPNAANPTNFAAVARLTDPVTDSNSAPGNFSVLKDPVLADDDALAFPATIKGPAIKGAAATTLWWKLPTGARTLLAQGGHVPNGVPGVGANAEFKTFNSLAIAATRGPLFTATLAAGKGGVTATTANGTWAVDFQGDLELLFLAGTKPDGVHTLKNFTILTAVPGSVGVTRSFNGAGQVTWLATFTDGTTAIVKTVVP